MDVSTLRKLLPDIDIKDSVIRKIACLDVDHETKVMNILSYYFNRKKSGHINLQPSDEEACYIKKLLPSLSLSYILEQLEMFKDLPNRREIVLRIIVNSRMRNGSINQNVKRHTSNAHPADQSNGHYYRPGKIRKITGSAAMYKVLAANDESYIPKQLLAKTSVLPNCHEIGRDLWQQEETLIPNVPKDVTSTSLAPPQNEQNMTFQIGDFQKPVRQGETETNFKNIEDNIKLEDHSIKQKVEVFGPKIIGEDELQVAEVCTISSSALEPQEEKTLDLELINDYIKEAMSTVEQDEKPSTYFSTKHIVEESALPVARNYAVTCNVSEVNSIDQPKQNFEWKLQKVNPTRLVNSVYSNDNVNKVSTVTLPESTSHGKSFLDNVIINDALFSKSNRVEIPSVSVATDVLQMPISKTSTPTMLESERQKVAPVVSFNSIRCVEENRILETPAISNNNLQEQTSSGNFNLVEYLYDITNAPSNIIRKECRKLNLSTSTRPDAVLLQLVIDNLLTNKISSGSSDEEEEPEMVETTPIGDIIQHLNKIRKMRSTQDPQPNIVPSEKPSTFAKPTASATITSQSQPHQIVSREPQTTITNTVAVSLRSKENVAAPESFSSSVNSQMVTYLCGIFPDAAPDYIRGLCKNKPMSNEVLDHLTTVILSTNGTYPKRPPAPVEADVFPENQLDILKEFLPDADPDYLRMMCDKFEGKPDMVKSFINEAMERRNYPTMKDYQRRQQLSAQQKQYTKEFSVENFIKLIPDPHAFFSDPQRTIKMDSLSSHYALVFLRNTFNKLALRTIQSTFTKNNCKLYNTVKELQHAMTQKHLIMKSTRKPMVMPNGIQNIPLLQEIAYFAHEREINAYLQEIKDKEEAERKDAISKGIIKTCDCCYDEEVLPKDIFCCEKGCPFCKSCIIKSTEVRFGEGKLDFPCLMNCSSYFTLQTLQAVLSPKLFSKIAQKKALEEIKSAGIDELEMCPFCDFATIPAEGYNIFSCLNPECMKESCRLCKEPSHIPLKCEEIEKDEDVKARVFVENKMTEALLRKCWKCGIKFFKEEGCNKMTCSCGAQMCYICGSPVTDYKHFNGNGGDRFDLCPLYSDTNVLNKENVLKGAAQAKAEIGNKALKYDPTTDVQQHYKERATKVPPQHIQHFHNVNQQQRVEAVFLGVREAIDRLEQRYPQYPF